MAADRLWQSKREILESVGFDTPQEFPISADGMPQQLLSYLRLSRLQNAAEFAKVTLHDGQAPSKLSQSTVCTVVQQLDRTPAPVQCALACRL